MKKNLRSIKAFLLTVLILSGLGLQGQNNVDSTKIYSAPGYLFKNSLIKMVKAEQLQVEKDSLLVINKELQARINISDSLLLNKDKSIETLMIINENLVKANELKDEQLIEERKECKKSKWKTGATTGVISFIVGLISSIFI